MILVIEGKEPLCDLIRIPSGLTDSLWASLRINTGFDMDLPTFWILEGGAYYMNQEDCRTLLIKTSQLSTSDSQLFMDIMH